MIPTPPANGSPAFGQYKPSETGEGFDPWALQVLELSGGRIAEITFFLDTDTLFPLFGLPPTSTLVGRPCRPHEARAARASSGDASLQARRSRPTPARSELQPGERVDGHARRRARAPTSQTSSLGWGSAITR